MSPIAMFALLSQSLYRLDQGKPLLTTEEWLVEAVGPLWRAADKRDLAQDVTPAFWEQLELSLDHVGALVASDMTECIDLLGKHGYSAIQQRASVVMAGLLGVPLDIVQGYIGAGRRHYRVEFFCPRQRGLADNKQALVQNWGRLGHGVHVGFSVPNRQKLFEAVKALSLGEFIAPKWYQHIERDSTSELPESLCYLDGFVESQRVRVEVGTC